MRVSDGFNLLILAVLVGLLGGEVALWAVNPLGIPARFTATRSLGLQMFYQQGTAMEPAVRDGERVIVSAWPYWHDQPHAGDIVIFAFPDDPNIADLKRVVAVGGSTVEIRQGVLYVDGVPRSEPYLHATQAASPISMPPVQVPAQTYFVLADNRDQSEDSRHYGPIPRTSIIGKLWHVQK